MPTGTQPGNPMGQSPPPSITRWNAFILKSAAKWHVPPGLLAALIQQESNGDPNAVSSAGAQGLTQLMPGTGRGLGVTNPFDAAQNIDAGAHYLAEQFKAFGNDWSKALQAYNGGPGGVGGAAEIQYAKAVLKNTPGYNAFYGAGPGSSIGGVVSGVVSAVTAPINAATTALDAAKGLFSNLTSRAFWVRVVEILGGGAILIIGLLALAGHGPAAKVAT